MEETRTLSVLVRTQSDAAAMKETLVAQQQLLQKLYAELDQEREASATAASEAMDMILRLQGEKAAVKMEASHYKRMAEEKISHAEATLEVFEELICQKDMEIASLEFQVKAYKQKVLSLGCDLNASEFQFLEDTVVNRSDQQNGENGQGSSTVRRLNSMPPIPFRSSLIVARKRDRSPTPVTISDHVIPEVVDGSSDQQVTPTSWDLTRKSVDIATLVSYWSQIKELDEKVRVISDCTEGEKCSNSISTRGRSSSIFSQASTKITCDQTQRLPSTNSDEVNHGERNGKVVANPPCSLNVHDVFEVPRTKEMHKVSDHVKKRLEKWRYEAKNRLIKPDSVSEGIVESSFKHDLEKGMFGVVHCETKTPNPEDRMTVLGQNREGVNLDCNAKAEFRKLHQRIERLEREGISSRQEITLEGHGEEQLRLLKDIQSQLNLIQSEMRSWKTRKPAPNEDVSLDTLQEAMLHFWI